MKAYISLPMTGKDLALQESKAREIASILMQTGAAVITPFDIVEDPENISYAKAMGMDIEALLGCSHIVLVDGWKESKGCTDEMFIALNHGVTPLVAMRGKAGDWSLLPLQDVDITFNISRRKEENDG